MTPTELAEIKARAEAATPGPWRAERSLCNPGIRDAAGTEREGWDFQGPLSLGDGECPYYTQEDATFIAAARADVPALVAEVERARRLLLWLSSAYLDALTSLRDEGCEPTQWGTHRNMERIATTIAESAPRGEPLTPEQQKALEAWAAEVTL
jgi:hypothetical protein